MVATRSAPEHEEQLREAEPEAAKVAEPEAPAVVLAPGAPLTPASVLTLQKTAGNAAASRLIAAKAAAGAGEDDEDELGRNRTVGAGARARIRSVGERPLQRMPATRTRQPVLQRAGPDHGTTPAGAKDADKSLSDLVLEHLQAPVDVSLETKPGGAGYVKCNKVGMKGQIKLSPSHVADGAPTTGAGAGGKTGDKNGVAVSIVAEAKTQLQKMLTDQMSKAVSDLVKSMTGKDNALKLELFAKAKAEAKAAKSGGKPELSTKVGYDFGLDATLFGGVKVTFTVKLTLIGLKLKKGSKGFEFEANAFAAEASQKVSVKAKDVFTIHDIPFSLEGSLEWGAEFEPNWSKIAIDAAADVGGEAAAAAVLEFAAVAGPPLLAGFVLASGIVAAGEKGALNANILTAAQDARSAATVFAQVSTGSDVPASGPRAKQAHDAAMNQIKQSATASGEEVEDLMGELREKGPAEYGKIYSQSRQQIYGAFDGEVRKTIQAWRKEHYVLAIWTREEDDIAAAKAIYDPILSK